MKGDEKTMKKTIIMMGVFLIAGALYFSLNKSMVYAANSRVGNGQGYGRQQMLTEKAKNLKMSVADLQNEVDKGKTFKQIAQEKGVNIDSMHEQMESYQKARLQGLVDAGTITKVEMQTRLDSMEQRQANCGNNVPFSGNGQRGMGMHR